MAQHPQPIVDRIIELALAGLPRSAIGPQVALSRVRSLRHPLASRYQTPAKGQAASAAATTKARLYKEGQAIAAGADQIHKFCEFGFAGCVVG